MSDPKTRHRRYRQFSLRTFLVVLTLACVWFGWQVNRANRQRKAVAWLLEMRGMVTYDYEVDDEGLYTYGKPTGPEWLRDFHEQVVFVHLNSTQVRDLTQLANLKSVEWLVLSDTLVHDLTPLANLKSLELLNISDTQVHDLTPLANLKSLQVLYLSGTQVRDLTPLTNLKSLRVLRLSGTPVSEEQITKLQQALPNCVILK